MYLQKNPIAQQTVEGYLTFLSRTNQDAECRELCDIIAEPYCYNQLFSFANRQLTHNTGRQIAGVSAAEMEGRRSMAMQLVTVLQLVKP